MSDFRHLNSCLVTLNPSVPLLHDTIQQLGASECEVLSVIDLRDAYHTLRLDEESKKYCGITPYYGSPSYLYQRLGMGLSVSPAIWQNFITKVLDEIPSKKHHIAIMDDCLIHSKRKDHITELIRLFRVLIKYSLKISLKKCQFFRTKLVYMGHNILIQDGRPCITPCKSRINAITAVTTPKTPKDCCSFCGIVNFLESFIPNLQTKLIPIYALTKKGGKFEWTQSCQQAFEDIKKALQTPPVLVMPNTTGLFQLQSDTSKIGCGAALFQVQNGVPQLCGYYSRKLPATAQNYGITELKLFGLTINITAFKNYLLHVFFEAYVDHSAIPWLMKAKIETKTTRIFRLLEILQKYHFAVKYQPGKEMYIADFLSHHPETHTDNDILPLSFEAFDSHRENFLQVTTRSMTKTSLPEKPVDPITPTSTSNLIVPHSTLPTHSTQHRMSATSSAVDWEALVKQLIEKAAEPKAEPEAPLHEVLNPIPMEIDLRGHVPDTQTRTTHVMQPPPDMHLRETHRLSEDMPKELMLVRRTLPKQEELKPLLRKLMCTALPSYKLPVKAVELTQAYLTSPYFKDIVQYLQQGKNP